MKMIFKESVVNLLEERIGATPPSIEYLDFIFTDQAVIDEYNTFYSNDEKLIESFDTATRDIILEIIAQKFVGVSWPCYGFGMDIETFAGKLYKRISEDGWTKID